MTDIMADWKGVKFVVADNNLMGIEEGNIIVLTDVSFWNDNFDELLEWCELNNAEVRGMTVTCDNQSLTAFALRWT